MNKPLLIGAAESVLVIVDIQERLLPAVPTAARESMIRNVRVLLKAAEQLGVPVILTEQYPKGLGATTGDLADAFPANMPRVAKTCFSCVGAEGFRAALAATGRPQVILAGMESHVCILQTALELLSVAEVFVVDDACCSRSDRHHQNGMSRMAQAGVVIVNYESVLFEWLRDASHERFKAVSGLLR